MGKNRGSNKTVVTPKEELREEAAPSVEVADAAIAGGLEHELEKQPELEPAHEVPHSQVSAEPTDHKEGEPLAKGLGSHPKFSKFQK